jgi:hypothetical protein
MKARKFIGGAIAIIGLMAAVSVCDGSAHEMEVRIVGTAMLIIGCLISEVFDFQNKKV